MPSRSAYEVIDFGGGARLERFGERTVDRPYPVALGARSNPSAWLAPDLRFDRDRGWTGPGMDGLPWPFRHDRLTLELRATEAGQVGLFPEHFAMTGWLRARVEEGSAAGASPPILHLFAYTGWGTLTMAQAGAQVTHVDASRPAVAWARRNAELSSLADRPIRWIVDDARGFVEREARRGRRYAGVVLDPPTYGHGPGTRPWRLEDDLPRLLEACGRLLEPGGFVLLTAHTPGFDAERLGRTLTDTLRRSRGDIEGGELAVSTEDGRALELGAFARTTGGA
ncbi:MAG TPA: hypothetical protein VKC59_01445 [Candidatus Limnocylindrales bacterium]|nr:hypothetical protein [Candidatus Limnocylindrales bacterium]